MHFHFLCKDKPDSLKIRLDTRTAHLDYLQGFGKAVVAAGPLLADDGQTMTGSVLILELADRAAAEAFAKNDPYAKAGLFASVTITPWRKVFPAG
jgi:uncharacterized protein